MDEYIEREAACSSMPDDYYGWRDKQLLKSIPSADVQPVRHGRYIGEYDGYADGNPVYDMWYCSECGCYFEEWDEKPTYNYCPNCGAKMDGGDTSERKAMAVQSQND